MEAKIGIVGAARRRQGLGPYVARFLRDEGAEIAGVCGRSIRSATEAAAALRQQLGIETQPFPDLSTLIREAKLDGLAICSPIEAHKQNLLDAAEGGVSVLCEKPLLWNRDEDPLRATEEVLSRFAAKGCGILLNAQWPRTIEPFRGLYFEESFEEIRRFEMFLGPGEVGEAMVLESVSHPLSLLFALVGPGKIEGIACDYRERDGIAEADFPFVFRHGGGKIDCLVHLKTQPRQPRAAWYAIDGHRVDREIQNPGYRFVLRGAKRTVEIEDPLKLQVRRFLAALRGEESFDSPEDLVSHSRGLKAFVEAFKLRR